MGTKIQANPFRQEYHYVIDLDANTSNATRSSYTENRMLQSSTNLDSISSYDIEKVKQKILEHESVFRNQLGELHRLYGRQRELMNEIKKRGTNKIDTMEEKFRLSYLLSPLPTENAKRSWNSSNNTFFRGGTYNLRFQERLSKFPVVERTSEKRNHPAACDGDDKFSFRAAAQTSQHRADALTFSLYNRNSYPTNGVSDRLELSRAEISANSCSNLNLVMKDLFHDSLDRMNKDGLLSIRGLRNERSGKEHLCDEYAVNSSERRRIDSHSSLEDLCSGKPVAFPLSLLAEPRKQFSNSASLSRKKKKIFGVEISEANDDAFDSIPKMSSNRRGGSHEENHRVPTSLIADSFVQNLSLPGGNRDEGNNERSKADPKGEISSQKRLLCQSDTNGKWLDSDSKIDSKNVDNANRDAECSQKSREMIPRHYMLADSQRNEENPKGSLPLFFKDYQASTDLNNGVKSSYFMNLDSLQSCSHKFFAKAETPDGALQTSKQKKEVKGRDSGENLGAKNIVLERGLNSYISDLRNCIDLNMSLDEEGTPFAPSFPSAIVKIANTEIDLEAPAVLESEMDVSPKELDSRESDMSPINSGFSNEDCDKIAAEAMIAISSSVEEKPVDESFTSLKWLAEVISSEHGAAASVAVHVAMNQKQAAKIEESIPDGMDFFEFTTLKLEESKEEHHHYKPFVLKAPSDDDTGAALMRRTRRGQSRGRQRRDFQRDILPGLVTLSRLQVTEDFQTFEELLKAGGATWPSRLSHRGSKRNGRGRKCLATSPTVKTPCSTQAEQPVCQIEERSLARWGKKTRRLPRQRCPHVFLSFPVKC